MRIKSLHRWHVAVGLALLVLAFSVTFSPNILSASPWGDAAEGKQIFQQKCSACHTIGQGPRVGPDLKGVGGRLERDFLVKFIQEPDKARPGSTMPALGVNEAETTSIVAFLTEGDQPKAETKTEPTAAKVEATPQASQPKAEPKAPASQLPTGDADRGKALVTGTVRFQNGGSACIACHNFAGAGGLSGGVLGPDITTVYQRFGDAGTASILATLPYPTMAPIFKDRPLTEQEQADVKAFLQQASEQEAEGVSAGVILIIGIAAALVLLAFGHVMWRRRRSGGVRQRLVRGN